MVEWWCLHSYSCSSCRSRAPLGPRLQRRSETLSHLRRRTRPHRMYGATNEEKNGAALQFSRPCPLREPGSSGSAVLVESCTVYEYLTLSSCERVERANSTHCKSSRHVPSDTYLRYIQESTPDVHKVRSLAGLSGPQAARGPIEAFRSPGRTGGDPPPRKRKNGKTGTRKSKGGSPNSGLPAIPFLGGKG